MDLTAATPTIGRARAVRDDPRTIRYLEIGALAVCVALPFFVSEFQISFATRLLLFALLALSLDLAWGYGGIVTIGQAAFFGAGAYTAGMLATREEMASVLVTIPAGALVAAVLALGLGTFLFAGRRKVGFVYVALATLVASFTLERLAATWNWVGGANGIPSVPLPTLGGAELEPGSPNFYYLVLAITVAIYLLLRLFVRSQFGLVLAAGREDLERVTFLGYRTPRAQILVFTIGGAIAGLGGGLFAFHEGFVSPSLLGIALSTQAIIWVLFGGRGTLIGAIVGLAIIEYAGQSLSERFPELWQIALGLILLLGIVYLRDGVIGLLASDRARVPRFGTPSTGSASDGTRDRTPPAQPALADRRSIVIAPEPPRAVDGRRPAPILTAHGIQKSYGGLQALCGADLTVAHGEVHGLIGPNGSGKSTLLHTIAGAVIADGGNVELNERRVTRWSSCARASAGLAIKFQVPRVFPELSVFDNILLSLQAHRSQLSLIRSSSRAQLSAQVLDCLRLFELDSRADELAGHLSHGEQQWLEIAMALAVSPRLLLLDEPTAGMSPEERRATGEVLATVSTSCSIVIVEHDLAFISSVCDQVTVLDQGRVLATGTPDEIGQSETVRSAFVGGV
jgi:branched-chain amino acid transport system permease protein